MSVVFIWDKKYDFAVFSIDKSSCFGSVGDKTVELDSELSVKFFDLDTDEMCEVKLGEMHKYLIGYAPVVPEFAIPLIKNIYENEYPLDFIVGMKWYKVENNSLRDVYYKSTKYKFKNEEEIAIFNKLAFWYQRYKGFSLLEELC